MRKNKVAGITLPDIKVYYKATVIKKAWHWHKETYKSMEQRAQKYTHTCYDQLIFDKGGKKMQWGKKQSIPKSVGSPALAGVAQWIECLPAN